MRRLFTDQSEKTSKKSDLFGISLSWELDGPILLDLLEKQNISLWSHTREEDDPIIFGGGPVLTANPEPFAPFLDVILLGDGEDLLPNFIDIMQEIRDYSRQDRLKVLARIPGIYIPSLYMPLYSSDGDLIAIEPINNEIPTSIKKQTWTSNILSHSQVITPESAWPNIHMIEVVRSCPELCRFCLASYLTLPFRTNSLEDGLIPAVEKGLRATNRLGLLGASVTQHPQFMDLLRWLSKDSFDDIHLSISSVRAVTVNSEMATILRKRGCQSLTIAIESGSERMRRVVNKKLSEEEIFNAAKYAYEGGLKKLKLYGMVGLPTEKEIDIEATINLILKIKKLTPGLKLTLGLSTFVPKAHTPFQWHGIKPEAKKRIQQIIKQLRPQGIEVRPESFGWSLIQTILSRSDRRLAPVIAKVRGSESSLGGWKKAYQEIRNSNIETTNDQPIPLPKLPELEEILFETWSNSQVLPWSHLEGPLKSEFLIQHQQQSLTQELN